MILKIFKNFDINKKGSIFKNLFKRIEFVCPYRADIIIYDEAYKEGILDCISNSKVVFIIKKRPSTIYINIKFISSWIKNLLKIEFLEEARDLIKNRGLLVGLYIYLKDMKEYTIIKLTGSKCLITRIDNNSRIGRLISKLKKTNFISIQNGCRPKWEFKEECKHDIYLSFSQFEIKNLKSMGWEANSFKDYGSLSAATHFSLEKNNKISRDILIVSSWRGNVKKDIHFRKQMESMKKMDCFLSEYLKNKDYKAEIILRSFKNGPHWFVKSLGMNEEEYFRRIYGSDINIIDHGEHNKKIYKEITRSHISLASLSSSILEANLYGYKSLYLNFGDDSIYYSDLPKDIVFSKDQLYLFDSQISELINESKENRVEIVNNAKSKSQKSINYLRSLIEHSSE